MCEVRVNIFCCWYLFFELRVVEFVKVERILFVCSWNLKDLKNFKFVYDRDCFNFCGISKN